MDAKMTTKTPQKLSDIYFAVVALLMQHGVIAGKRGNIKSGFCALGAIDYVKTGNASIVDRNVATDLRKRLNLGYVRDKHNADYTNYPLICIRSDNVVAAWSNNLVDAGKSAEVIKSFRKAAESALAEGV